MTAPSLADEIAALQQHTEWLEGDIRSGADGWENLIPVLRSALARLEAMKSGHRSWSSPETQEGER